MRFELIVHNDLEKIRHLQPDGWSDIVNEFKFYVDSEFCYPIQTKINNKIAGIGTLIEFGNTAWLAHIIVDPNHRRIGIGYQIVEELLKYFENRSIDTCLLIATELGKSVYEKAGFRLVTEYTFLKKEKSSHKKSVSEKVIRYKAGHRDMIFELDKDVSGENRADLLVDYLKDSFVYLDHNKILGFYLPNLREGLIVADNDYAGRELLKLKLPTHDKVVLPSDNITGIEFLRQNGFTITEAKGTRMILGKEINWQPKKIFSRIGGNFG